LRTPEESEFALQFERLIHESEARREGKKSETLIVVAAYDDKYADNLETLHGGDVLVYNTSEGGYTTGAYINAFRKHYYHSYLFLQDSLRGNVDDVVAPFKANGRNVVGWGSFPLFFDDQHQEVWVRNQYPGERLPPRGIFGPIFYATRKALKHLEDRDMFPKTPPNKLMEQGNERGWAMAFYRAGIPVGYLGGTDMYVDGNPWLTPTDTTFKKTFGGRT
jgi:hypothetical protein